MLIQREGFFSLVFIIIVGKIYKGNESMVYIELYRLRVFRFRNIKNYVNCNSFKIMKIINAFKFPIIVYSKGC